MCVQIGISDTINGAIWTEAMTHLSSMLQGDNICNIQLLSWGYQIIYTCTCVWDGVGAHVSLRLASIFRERRSISRHCLKVLREKGEGGDFLLAVGSWETPSSCLYTRSTRVSPLHGCLSKHFKWKCTWHFRRRCNHQTLECSWHHSEWAGFLLPRSRLLFQLIEKPTEDNTRKFIEHRCCVFSK